MRPPRFLLLFTPLLAALLPTIALAAPRYTVIPIGESNFRFDDSYATAINPSGQIAGMYTHNPGNDTDDSPFLGFSIDRARARTITVLRTASNVVPEIYPSDINANGFIVGSSSATSNEGPRRAFVAQNGSITDLPTLGGSPDMQSFANAINDAGQIVGSSPTTGAFHAFLYSAGVMTDIDPQGGSYSSANAINDRGEIVGVSGDHAFLYSAGSLRLLPGPDSSATGINNHGQIVGTLWVNGGINSHAFLHADGKMRDLGTLGGPNSAASAINDHGEIVGGSDVPKSRFPRAFLSTGEKLTDLNNLIPANSEWTIYYAAAINDAGLIVGYGRTKKDTRNHALLIAPVPQLTVLGGTNRMIHGARITLHGRADRSVALVTYSRKNNRNFLARGVARWHLTAKLHPGRNVIIVTARGLGGNVASTRVIVTRT